MSFAPMKAICTLVMAVCLMNAWPSSASADVVERVVGVVNDEALFLSELRRRSIPFLDRLAAAPTDAERTAGLLQLYTELLDRMVDEVLIEQAAGRMQVRVTSADVDRAIQNVARENNLTEEQFWQAVQGQGFTESQYRADVRRQILRLKVINQRVRGRVNVTEAEVRALYDQRFRQANRQVRLRASHVFLALPPEPSAADIAAARAEATQVREGLSDANFLAATQQYGGGELGWLSEGELPADLEEALLGLSPGEFSTPVRGVTGFHIFYLHERERGGADLPAFTEVREQLQRQMMERQMVRQEQEFLRELRRDAIIDKRL